MTEKVSKFINTLQKGQNAEAGEAFKDALRDKVASALDQKRVDMAAKIFDKNLEQDHSDPKPVVTEPAPRTDTILDTDGNEIKFEPNTAPEPTAPVPETTPATVAPEAPAVPEAPAGNEGIWF